MSYLLLIPLVLFALYPPHSLTVNLYSLNPQSILFYYLVMISGFLSLVYLNVKVNIFAKLLLLYIFINCFFSVWPHASLCAFIFVVGCAYIYLWAQKIKDWNAIFDTLKIVLLFDLIILVMQVLRQDVLFNFGQTNITHYGTIGNLMQFKSFMLLLVAFIIQDERIHLKFVVILLGVFGIYLCFHVAEYWKYFFYARGKVWFDSLKLANKHPFFGWGIGTYKVVFPALAKGSFTLEGNWLSAHNFLINTIFELGYIGFILALGFIVNIILKCKKNFRSISGLILTGLNMSWCFPERMPQSIIILVLFAAYLGRKL